MGAKRVINGVHVVPIGMANAFLIEGNDGLTLIDAGFRGKEAPTMTHFFNMDEKAPTKVKHWIGAVGPTGF